MSQFSCYGILSVQEAFVSNFAQDANKTNPKIKNISSYKVYVPCYTRADAFIKGDQTSTGIVIKTEQSVQRISGKNLYKDVKNSVCAFSGEIEGSKVRKRLIALQKIHGNISNQNFNFSTCPTITSRNLSTINGSGLTTVSGKKIVSI